MFLSVEFNAAEIKSLSCSENPTNPHLSMCSWMPMSIFRVSNGQMGLLYFHFLWHSIICNLPDSLQHWFILNILKPLIRFKLFLYQPIAPTRVWTPPPVPWIYPLLLCKSPLWSLNWENYRKITIIFSKV